MNKSVFALIKTRGILFACLLALLPVGAAVERLALRGASGQVTLTDINPDNSSLDASNANGASGGRVNGLAADPGNNQVFYAASEWGGLYKSTNGGQNWARLNNHRPTVTWDVEVSPANSNLVIATSFYDGRVNPLSGINVSTDGGNNWTKPATATPPVNFCAGEARRNEPSAFGISIDPDNTNNIYVGTNCGLAISTDSGGTWAFVDPTPGTLATDVWDVVVHHGGIIDLVGDDGHRRSIDGGANWTTATSNALPGGVSSIAVSPDESYVLFAVVGTSIFESDNGGTSWDTTFANPGAQGRVPFVTTNNRAGADFDLWFGDTQLFRAGCSTPATPAPGGAARCPASGSWTNSQNGAHWDLGDVVFDTAVADDRCPRVMSSDGGVYRNTTAASPGCHGPAWEQPNVTPHALWLFGMDGADQAGATMEDLYFGCQDNGTFASTDAGAASPAWTNRDCCDGFDDSADPGRILYTVCCSTSGRANRLFVRNPGMTAGSELSTYPAGNLPGFGFIDIVDRFDANSYVLLTTSGIFVTTSIAAPAWTQLGAASTPAGACGVQASGPGATPSFFATAGTCDFGPATFWRHDGTAAGGTWTQVNPPGGTGSFGVIKADPNNPNRIFASHINGNIVNMVLSTDGGANWTVLGALDSLMTGGGIFRYRNTRGPANFTSLSGYTQPTLVEFDPANSNILIAGGADSGIFLSTNAGLTWTVLTDNSGGTANPHIPRPRFAYFDHEAGDLNIYVGTQGRGVWRVQVPDATADLAITKTASAPTIVTGTNVTYTLTVRNNGPDAAQMVEIKDVLPPQTSFVGCGVIGGTGGMCIGTGNDRTITLDSLAANATATITLVAQVSCSLVDGTVFGNSATVGSLAADPVPANNTSSISVMASNPPPVITCPPDQNVATALPGQMSVAVNYPPPVVMDNCPGTVINCSHPSGSNFPLGNTVVKCTATDSGGRMAMCSFNVTVFDVCIQDDASRDFILFNSFTGDYLFTKCGIDGFKMPGRGAITRSGCSTRLQDDTRVVSAEIQRCSLGTGNTGSASIRRMPFGTSFNLGDSYILNNTCMCP